IRRGRCIFHSGFRFEEGVLTELTELTELFRGTAAGDGKQNSVNSVKESGLRLSCPHAKAIVSAGWDGAGLPGALCVDCPADLHFEGREHFGALRVHADRARDLEEPAANTHRRGLRHRRADAATRGLPGL